MPLILIFLLLLFFFLSAAFFMFFASMVRGAPYVQTYPETVQKMISLALPKKGEKAADLGSGDGRIVIALAKTGTEAHGYEINPFLVWLSRRKIRRAGLSDRAFVHWKSFWGENFSSFDIITVYGIGYIMRGLERKLKKELKPGARVVSNSFAFPNWQCVKRDEGVRLYKKD